MVGGSPDLLPQFCKGGLVAKGLTTFQPLFLSDSVGSFLGIPDNFRKEGYFIRGSLLSDKFPASVNSG